MKNIFLLISGVDDGIAPYLRCFIAFDINGSKLINIDSDALRRIGINKEATRTKIISAINLLVYYVGLNCFLPKSKPIM